MSKEHITYRIIDGVLCCCKDTGCDDFDRAEFNRYIIANKLFTTGYILVEEALAHTPLSEILASWIPQGELPQVDRKDWQQHGGERGGIYEIVNSEVVGT